ncbi:SufD family Fe-S cluster assembly protein [Candidatus Woesearchaeota archaeon]|nr:SufD family Fe-S cluster assembly protein [Candidatus Woesearchaeota archaeon]
MILTSNDIVVPAHADITLLDTGATNHRITISEGARVRLVSVFTQPRAVQRTIELVGKGASYEEHDILVGTEKDEIAVTSDVTNAAPDTTTKVSMQGVLDGCAKASCVGNMKIIKGATKADSRLSQHILLLSPEAKADTQPNLEIDENDVHAGHAATVRPIDQDSLFYLRSRGISEAEARRMLVLGFITPFLASLDAADKLMVLDTIEEKLDHAIATH